MHHQENRLGATYLGDNICRFRVWAPESASVSLSLVGDRRRIPMTRRQRGYHEAIVEGIAPGDRYFVCPRAETERPDPASRLQPEGVHGPSEVVDEEFPWQVTWAGIALEDYVIYELHVGAFSAEGTFEGAISHLDYLLDLGVTAVELMPIAEFPGARNWGYDGVDLFAAHHSYGGPVGFKKLVDACHERGMAVILDVVYNHLGPEGNYLGEFGPYFTPRYQSPWGPALNFDGADSDEVREFFIQNALYWLVDCRVDALRLDAVHAILDHSPITFLEDLSAAVERAAARTGRRIFLIAESADNDARLLRPRERGGYALDAQWNDDFHHSLRTLLTGERDGYYRDYGEFSQLGKAVREGFVYSGEYSRFRRRRHGSSSADIPHHRLVVFSQNHDQIGNRMGGDRLCHTLSFAQLKLAAALVLLGPNLPLLFMGEEYGEQAPFPYFVSHSDPALVEAVRRGRREEFASFQWQGEVPDPQDEATFVSAKLRHHLRSQGEHRALLEFYRELLALRKSLPALRRPAKNETNVTEYPEKKVLLIKRGASGEGVLLIANFDAVQHSIEMPVAQGGWCLLLDSAAPRWGGTAGVPLDEAAARSKQTVIITAHSASLFRQENDQ